MKHDPEQLTGYLDNPSYAPGAMLHAKISSRHDGQASLVRLRHGDTNPAGPGLLQDSVHGTPTTAFPAELQELRAGSHGRFDLPASITVAEFTMSAWIWPTAGGQRCILHCENSTDRVSLIIDGGHLGLVVGTTVHLSGLTVRERSWQFVTAAVDQINGTATLTLLDGGTLLSVDFGFAPQASPSQLRSIVIGARIGDDGREENHFNGKIEAPTLWNGTIAPAQVNLIARDPSSAVALVRIDFSSDQMSVTFRDNVSGATGELINTPTRGVTGHLWQGQTQVWTDDPALYAAVHFHDDDLTDAGWKTSLTFPLPADLESGFYALWLVADGYEDWLTFVVTRDTGRSAKSICVVVPTLTYLAYANEPIFPPHVPTRRDARDDWASRHGLVSQYNWHSDGSGVTHASWRRPMMNLRPDYRYWLTGHPHGPGADLYLLHWLDEVGITYDLTTDHDLHAQGPAALSDYTTLVTGCHPEYWTAAMLATLEAFENRAGRVAYLGGNGLAALVGISHDQPWVSEMRRRGGLIGLWDSDPGEVTMAADGAHGGLTRHHCRRSRELVGVDIAGMGFADGQPFHRQPCSHDQRVNFLFRGVEGEVIGDFGLHMGGAAGYEVDSADFRTGTPQHALVLATCETLPPHFVAAEQRGAARADMVFFETASGGAVFAASSITWTGCLSHRGGDNGVARITENVLRRFIDPAPFVYSRDMGRSGGPASSAQDVQTVQPSAAWRAAE